MIIAVILSIKQFSIVIGSLQIIFHWPVGFAVGSTFPTCGMPNLAVDIVHWWCKFMLTIEQTSILTICHNVMHDQLSYMYLQSKCLLSSNTIKLFYIHLFFLNAHGYTAESPAGQPGIRSSLTRDPCAGSN